jgi:hypothetical protein
LKGVRATRTFSNDPKGIKALVKHLKALSPLGALVMEATGRLEHEAAPARRSPVALDKIRRRRLDDGTPVQSFSPLVAELFTLVRNTCRVPGTAADVPPFERLTTPAPRRALDLIEQIRV